MSNNDNKNHIEKISRAAEQKTALRKQAEEQIQNMEPISLSAQTPEDSQRLLHELRVHQIELEMQNEELRTAQAQIEAGMARYMDLYDLAPVGYCTLSEKGLILEANLMVATLLGTARGALLKQPLSRFIFKDDQDIFYLHRKQLLETRTISSTSTAQTGDAQEFELRLVKPDGTNFWAHLTANAARTEDGAPVCRVVLSDVTRQKQAEAELEFQAYLLRDIMENTLSGFWDWNMLDNTKYLSPTFKRMFGYEDHEMENSPEAWQRIIFPEDLPGVFANCDRHVKSLGRQPFYNELRYRHKDGSTVWVICAGRVIEWTEDGTPIRMVGCHIDVTERKRAEEESAQSAALLRDVLDMVPAYICAKNSEGRFLLVNGKLADFYGISIDNLTGMLHADMCEDKEELQAMLAADRQVLESGRPILIPEETMKRPDGSIAVLETYKIPFFAAGEPAVLIASVDITERVRIREALKASEIRFQELLRNVPTVAVQGYSLDGTVHYWNHASETFYGYTTDEAIGKNLLDLIIPPAMRESVKETISRIIETGETPPASEMELMRKDRSLIPVFSSHALVELPGQEPGLFCVDIDLTEIRQIEAEQKKLQAQYLQAHKMEAVGRLAGGVAHDFNNMLLIIIGYADMMLEQLDSTQPFYENLMEIKKAGERSADLTRRLLAFARKQTVVPEVIDLNEAVKSMLKMMHRLLGEDIEMTWIPDEKLWPIKIDPSQIDQILANLCVNARDAIAGVGKISIETGNIFADEEYCKDQAGFVPGEYVMLAISDNGCGMNDETIDHLFEPFFTTKELGKGTGLGLATVYGNVKQNNGYISVFSELNQGTTFKIYLPRHQSETVPLPEIESNKKTDAECNETILLVEDETAILKITTRILKGEGYTVISASTPKEAIRLANEFAGDIHLLVSDVVMPEMNGRDLANNILSLYPHLKCLFMSGYNAEIIAHHGVLDEGINFLQKPFSISNLTKKMREVLDRE